MGISHVTVLLSLCCLSSQNALPQFNAPPPEAAIMPVPGGMLPVPQIQCGLGKHLDTLDTNSNSDWLVTVNRQSVSGLLEGASGAGLVFTHDIVIRHKGGDSFDFIEICVDVMDGRQMGVNLEPPAPSEQTNEDGNQASVGSSLLRLPEVSWVAADGEWQENQCLPRWVAGMSAVKLYIGSSDAETPAKVRNLRMKTCVPDPPEA